MSKGLLTAAIISISCSTSVFAASCDDTRLLGYMHEIKDEIGSLSSDLKSGDNQSAAGHASALIGYFEKARNETPYKFQEENLKGNALKEQQAEFTKVVDDTIVILKDLETALKSNNASEARKLLGAVGGQRKIGHSSFKANC